jgi:hypothetical protein
VVQFSCFVSGTKISLANGTKKNIEMIRIGDQVVNYYEANFKMSTSTVLSVQQHAPSNAETYTFTLSNRKVVTSNNIHLFYLPLLQMLLKRKASLRAMKKTSALRFFNFRWFSSRSRH